MFEFFRKKRLVTYEQPLLMANSSLPGFWDLVKFDGSKNSSSRDLRPWIKLIDESEIPYGQLYFKYIGEGKCIRAMKHDPFPKSKLEATLQLDVRNRINDHTHGVNHFSNEYQRSEMGKLLIHLRNELKL